MRIQWLPEARQDLDEATSYIDLDQPTAAVELGQIVVAAVLRLAQFPQLGRAGREPDTRELILPEWPYIIVYDVTDEVLTVLAILHTRKRYPTSLS